MVVYARNAQGTVRYVPLYEHIFKPVYCTASEESGTVSDKLRYFRMKSGLRQKDMAELLKIDRSTYVRYESGTITGYPPDVIKRCAEIFGIEADRLLDDYNRFIFGGQGEQVRKKRIELGLTQGGFGKLCGVSKNTVRRWENGSVRMSRKMWERVFGKDM